MVERKKADELLDFGVEKEKTQKKQRKMIFFQVGKGHKKCTKK